MARCILMLTALVAVALAEPPVPQGQYGAPGGGYPGGAPGGGYSSGRPSSQYGAPGFGAGGGYAGAGGAYKDPRDNPMFTHEQDFQRPGGEIWGMWTVALPDGRIQKVEYDADETGFHPVITYEEPGSGGNGGYGSGGNGGYNSGGNSGYSSGGGRQGGYRYR